MTMQIDGNLFLDLRLCEKFCDLVRDRFTINLVRSESDQKIMYLENKTSKDCTFYFIDDFMYYDLLEKKESWGIQSNE